VWLFVTDFLATDYLSVPGLCVMENVLFHICLILFIPQLHGYVFSFMCLFLLVILLLLYLRSQTLKRAAPEFKKTCVYRVLHERYVIYRGGVGKAISSKKCGYISSPISNKMATCVYFDMQHWSSSYGLLESAIRKLFD
jgi:hypothetical protein